PEPHQALDEAELGTERGVDADLGLLEIDLLQEVREHMEAGRGGRRRATLCRNAAAWSIDALMLSKVDKAPSAAPVEKAICAARGFPAGEQIRIGDATG